MVNSLKDRPCEDCGGTFHPWQMDFDHREPETKLGNVGDMLSDKCSMEAILAEIEKCDLVCACCHRHRTHLRNLSLSSR